MLVEPVNLILRWYDELQVAQVSLARLVGVPEIERPTPRDDAEPGGPDCAGRRRALRLPGRPWTCCTV